MKSINKYTVVLPAAGVGSRMQAAVAKQYLLLNAKAVIEHSVETLLAHDAIASVIVVLHPNDKQFQNLECASDPRVTVALGGKERVDSVLAGLKACAEISNAETASGKSPNPHQQSMQSVLVHDAARPCVSHQEITNLIAQYEAQHKAHCEQEANKQNTNIEAKFGAILATQVVDTIKLAQTDEGESSSKSSLGKSVIQKTVDRSALWQAQTPQMFPLEALINAIEIAQQKNIVITDEASAMEHIGAAVTLVEGRSSNIKITRPSDLSLAEFYLKRNNKET